MALDEDKLKGYEILEIVLSGFETGARINRKTLTEVFHDEEYSNSEEDIKVHPIFQETRFTGRDGREAKPLSVAWMNLAKYLLVESVGQGDDYLVGHGLVEVTDSLRERGRISEEDFDYLTGLREKYNKRLW